MPSRRALLIGINEYKAFTNLEGCENDVRMMREVLQARYEFTHIRTLLSTEATGKAIRVELQRLVEDTKENDIVVFYFAGHGSQMRDDDNDEPSGFDNTLMPSDTQHDATQPELNTDIVDDELRGVFARLAEKTPYVTIIVDACHSGTITRGAAPSHVGATRGVPPYLGPRPAAGGLARQPRTRSAPTYTALMACRDAELAREMFIPASDGTIEHHGALSYYFVQRLQQASASITARELFEQVAHDVHDFLNGQQRPQMEGMVDRQLFGIEARVPMSYLRISRMDAAAGTLTLAAGAALGVLADARIAVYAPGTITAEGTVPLIRGRVSTVSAIESVVALDGGFRTEADETATGEATIDGLPVISPLARVVVEELPETRRARPVYLAPLSPEVLASNEYEVLRSHADSLQKALAEAKSVVLVEQPEVDALRLTLWPPAVTGNGWRWAVCGPDGSAVAPTKAVGEVREVVRNCQILSRQWIVKQLANTAMSSRLSRGAIRVEFLTAPGVGEPFALAALGDEGLPVVQHAKTAFRLRVHNDHRKPVYVTLIDFTMDGEIVQRFPPEGATSSTAIPVGSSFEIFDDPDDPQGYGLPDIVPWVPEGALPARNDGIATQRLFVTEEPVNFSFLCSGEVVRSSGTTLEQLMAEQVGVAPPPATRGQMSLAKADVDWTVVDVRFLVRRDDPERLPLSFDRAATNAGFVVRQALTPESRDGSAPIVQLDPVPEGFARVLVMVGDDGVPQFVFPEAPATRSAGGVHEFALPLVPSGDSTRSAAAIFALPAVKELLYSSIDRVFGKAGEALAVTVEEQIRPYAFRRVPMAPVDAPWPEVRPDEWSELAAGKVLFLLHGVLGTGQGTFSALPLETLSRLQEAYGGRVIVFDHPSVGHDPLRNAREFVSRLPSSLAVTADVVALSRGGLIARILANEFESLAPDGRTLRIERTVLLGTPNDGTPLADLKNLKMFTKLVPYAQAGTALFKATQAGASVVKAAQSVMTGGVGPLLWPLVGQAALSMVTSLPGLESMIPKGEFLKARPAVTAQGTRYFGIASSLEAADGLGLRAARSVLGLELGKQHDLLVDVPSALSPGIPFEATRLVDGAESVTNFGYLESPVVQATLIEWLLT